MELTDALKALFVDTAQALKGSARRIFMARTVKELGLGGQRRAERELGWNRGTLRKGMHEFASGFTCLDAFAARGRKRAEDHLPHLLVDIKALVDSQSQTDPQLRTTRLYTRLSAAEVRRQLIAQQGYTDDALPTVQSLTTKLNALGYYPKKVAKSQPQTKSQQPRPSSPKGSGAIRRPTPHRTCYGSHSTLRRPSRWALLPVAGRVARMSLRPITILLRQRRSLPWAFSSLRGTNCCCTV